MYLYKCIGNIGNIVTTTATKIPVETEQEEDMSSVDDDDQEIDSSIRLEAASASTTKGMEEVLIYA